MTIGVILMTYGAPAGDEDVAAYLGRVRGREPTPELALEMRRRGAELGGAAICGGGGQGDALILRRV